MHDQTKSRFCRMHSMHVAAILGVLPFALHGTEARAQTVVQQSSQPETQDQNPHKFSVGLGLGYAPAYEGARDYRVLPMPAINVTCSRSDESRLLR